MKRSIGAGNLAVSFLVAFAYGCGGGSSADNAAQGSGGLGGDASDGGSGGASGGDSSGGSATGGKATGGAATGGNGAGGQTTGGSGAGGNGTGGAGSPVCGNGKLDAGEACDDGDTNDGDDCRGDCLQDLTQCGDGALDTGEACDDGDQNASVPGSTCLANCQLPGCGDGILDAGLGEKCDDGPSNSDTTHNACSTDCKERLCIHAQVDDTVDFDGDGYAKGYGDCNECAPTVNPGAIDLLNVDDKGVVVPELEQVDDDCSGTAVQVGDELGCDAGLDIDDSNAVHGAMAMDICKMAENGSYGLVSAQWVQMNGTALPATSNAALGHGLLSTFGSNVGPQFGAGMLGLSSGTARIPGQAGYVRAASSFTKGYSSTYPNGFPYDPPACPGIASGPGKDSVGLRVTLKVPTNAFGFSFKSKFYSAEYPKWVCTEFNDLALVLLNPTPAGASNGNVLYDSFGNPMSINAGFMTACTDVDAGFDGGGETTWLTSTAPVEPGSTIILTFAITDAGDDTLDSSILFDDFKWLANTPTVGTDPVGLPK